MPKHSAGILLYRFRDYTLELFLVHPGGPFWAKKDRHAWSIPKGEFNPDTESPLSAAKREFREEIGLDLPAGDPIDLGQVRSSSKIIHAFALAADLDPAKIKSNTFKMQWPPNSGQYTTFPEVDQAAWFPAKTAPQKLHKSQSPLPTRLAEKLNSQ